LCEVQVVCLNIIYTKFGLQKVNSKADMWNSGLQTTSDFRSSYVSEGPVPCRNLRKLELTKKYG
jgi:hypothetical protein